MRYGDYNNKVVDDSFVRDILYWLRLVHSAGVVQRDIRSSNIVRFSPVSTYVEDGVSGPILNNPTDKEPEWQLIDFNIGNIVAQNEVICINKASGQYRGAGRAVKSVGEQSASETFDYKWTTSDDYEMLCELMMKVPRKQYFH